MMDACFSLPWFVVVRLVARRSSLVTVIFGRSLDAISDVGSGGDYPMRASIVSIVSERAMANVMVETADDGGRIVGMSDRAWR